MIASAQAARERPAIFISHANPDDNTFTLWLAAKLTSLGYEVWADVMRLLGGDDWQRRLEAALRERAFKVLLVANPVAVDKQGVRNEIQIATDVAKEIGDNEFIIPLRLAEFKAPFLIAHTQYIDFMNGWARGLADLVGTLDKRGAPKSETTTGSEVFRAIQLLHAKQLVNIPETLTSNWLAIERLPGFVRLYDFKSGISIGQSQTRMGNAPWPLIVHKRGFLSFAPLRDLQDHFSPDLPLVLLGELPTKEFLDGGWPEHFIEPWIARNNFADLARRAMDRMFQSRSLASFELANKQMAWWADGVNAPTNKVSFNWDEATGLRQIQGTSAKRKMQWHYGVSTAVRIMPTLHIRIVGRLIFTADGTNPFPVARMHRLRRSFAKSWRNARWRDMMLAFLWWVTDGKTELLAPTSADDGIAVRLPPLTFSSPVSVPLGAAWEPAADDDDPSDDEDDEVVADEIVAEDVPDDGNDEE